MQSWHNRPIHWQFVENWEISVQSEIKPNLTAVRQVWAHTGGQAQAVARGSSAILSVPRNRQNELLWVVTILPQSRPQYLQSGWLRLDSGFWGILMQFRQIALRLDRNCAHSDYCPGLRFEASDWSPGPVDLLQSSRWPAIPETGFAGSLQSWLQSCGLWIDCKFNAILTQFRRIASGLQPNATNRPRIAPGRNQTGTHPNLNPKQSTQNIRTAILTAIFTIELNCNKIAKPQRIARGLKGLHQNPGKSTNCKKTSPIAPESAYFRNRSGIRVRSTQNRLLPMPDRGTIDPKTTSINSIKLDCNWIAKLKRIAIGLQN